MFDILVSLAVAALLYVAAIALAETSYGWKPIASGVVQRAPRTVEQDRGQYQTMLMREDLVRVFSGSLCMIALLVVLRLAGFSAITLPFWLYSAVILFCYVGDTAHVMTSARPAGYQ